MKLRDKEASISCVSVNSISSSIHRAAELKDEMIQVEICRLYTLLIAKLIFKLKSSSSETLIKNI